MQPKPPKNLDVELVEVDGLELAVVSFEAPSRDADLAALSAAEREVVRAVLAGAPNAGIARARGTSARTVANQLASIFRKLGVASRHELVARLAKSG
jgi:DNA-binding CsgD family transcriptional regulator